MLFESSVQEVHGLKEGGIVPDAVGIEVEMEFSEGFSVEELYPVAGDDWQIKSDGSLRNFGLEFVSRPFSLRHEGTVLSKTWTDLIEHKRMAKANHDCPRASVHVHVNVRDYTYNQLMNIILAYLLLEGTLVDYCGRWRRGNLFALRIPEAAANFTTIKSAITNFHSIRLSAEQRYSAMNLVSLNTFGTIEFRMLGSVYNPQLIERWASGLRHMVDRAATNFASPPDVYRRYTSASRQEFVAEFLGDLGREILKKPLSEELFEDGEEYAVEFLTSSTDNWTYTDDFRGDRDYLEYIKKARISRRDFFSQNKANYKSWKKSFDATNKKTEANTFGLESLDWSPEEVAISADPFEEPRVRFGRTQIDPIRFTLPDWMTNQVTAPNPSAVPDPASVPPFRFTPDNNEAWREGELPPSTADISIYEDARGERWIHWAGVLPVRAFNSEADYTDYANTIQSGFNEWDVRRTMDLAGRIREDWIQVRLSEMWSEMDSRDE